MGDVGEPIFEAVAEQVRVPLVDADRDQVWQCITDGHRLVRTTLSLRVHGRQEPRDTDRIGRGVFRRPAREAPDRIALRVGARCCLIRQLGIEKSGLLPFSSNGTWAAIGYPTHWCLKAVHWGWFDKARRHAPGKN
jgi:hypothetical protein